LRSKLHRFAGEEFRKRDVGFGCKHLYELMQLLEDIGGFERHGLKIDRLFTVLFCETDGHIEGVPLLTQGSVHH